MRVIVKVQVILPNGQHFQVEREVKDIIDMPGPTELKEMVRAADQEARKQ